MIRRFFTFLLAVLMLASQGLCLGHAHDHGGEDSEGHDARPHFHWAGHVHHKNDHRHEHSGHEPHDHSSPAGQTAPSKSDERSSTPPCDHDSDAVYVGGLVTIARIGNSGTILPDMDLIAGLAILPVEHRNDALLRTHSSHGRSSFLGEDACPIYLRTLSLRL